MRCVDGHGARVKVAKDEDCVSARDCITLLSYVSQHRIGPQTFHSLWMGTGIPEQSLWKIVQYALDEGKSSMLGRIARKYGFEYKVYKQVDENGRRIPYGRIIDAERLSGWAYIVLEGNEEDKQPTILPEDKLSTNRSEGRR